MKKAPFPGEAPPDVKNDSPLSKKTVTFFAAAFSFIWIITLTILKGLRIIELSITEIIISGTAATAQFLPVYSSIFLDKLRTIRLPSDP